MDRIRFLFDWYGQSRADSCPKVSPVASRPRNWRPFATATPSRSRKWGQELGVAKHFTDYRQAVTDKDIDAVVIVTPDVLAIATIACAAAENGKHVFLEKTHGGDRHGMR